MTYDNKINVQYEYHETDYCEINNMQNIIGTTNQLSISDILLYNDNHGLAIAMQVVDVIWQQNKSKLRISQDWLLLEKYDKI